MRGGRGKGPDDGSAPRDDGHAARDDGSAVPDDGSIARDDGYGSLKKMGNDGSAVPDDGSAAHDDGYGSLKKMGDDGYRVGRRRIQARATTAEIARRRVAGRATTDPTPCGHVAATVYKGGQISSGFTLRLAAPDPSSPGEFCRTCVELF